MMESNPPAQPEELRRRIFFLLKEAQRRVDYPYLSDIAKDLGETPEDIKDQLDIKADLEFENPVTLGMIKATPGLENMVLVKNSRLSVQPVRPEEWNIIVEVAGAMRLRPRGCRQAPAAPIPASRLVGTAAQVPHAETPRNPDLSDSLTRCGHG